MHTSGAMLARCRFRIVTKFSDSGQWQMRVQYGRTQEEGFSWSEHRVPIDDLARMIKVTCVLHFGFVTTTARLVDSEAQTKYFCMLLDTIFVSSILAQESDHSSRSTAERLLNSWSIVCHSRHGSLSPINGTPMPSVITTRQPNDSIMLLCRNDLTVELPW